VCVLCVCKMCNVHVYVCMYACMCIFIYDVYMSLYDAHVSERESACVRKMCNVYVYVIYSYMTYI
jgi:hypothetical protein